jgi:polyisoprenoid-binding protein YceI
MKRYKVLGITLGAMMLGVQVANAADYVIDTEGSHAFIQFKIPHLGYSMLLGRFNDFEGAFSYDEVNPDDSSVEVVIETASLDSNHAERDKHLRSEDFLYVDKYPKSRFVSTSFKENGDGTAVLKGDLTLKGVTRPVTIDVKQVGHGPDPWASRARPRCA